MHPYLWRYLEGGTLRSWGAKSLQESGKRGEPFLAGDGYARIGEGSGCTNVLTGSGVDEAWTTGTQLAEGVLELLKANRHSPARTSRTPTCARRAEAGSRKKVASPKTRATVSSTASSPDCSAWALAGLTGGRLALHGDPRPPHERIQHPDKYFAGKLTAPRSKPFAQQCAEQRDIRCTTR